MGIGPATVRLRSACSTNWAKAAIVYVVTSQDPIRLIPSIGFVHGGWLLSWAARHDPGRTRSCSPWPRGAVPYPLGHEICWVWQRMLEFHIGLSKDAPWEARTPDLEVNSLTF